MLTVEPDKPRVEWQLEASNFAEEFDAETQILFISHLLSFTRKIII